MRYLPPSISPAPHRMTPRSPPSCGMPVTQVARRAAAIRRLGAGSAPSSRFMNGGARPSPNPAPATPAGGGPAPAGGGPPPPPPPPPPPRRAPPPPPEENQ